MNGIARPHRRLLQAAAFALCLVFVGFNAVRAPDFDFPLPVEYQPYEMPTAAQHSDTAPPVRKVNINTANALELQSLPGIGEKTAQGIVKYRKEHGKFQSRKDLLKVPGIGEKTYEKLKESITV